MRTIARAVVAAAALACLLASGCSSPPAAPAAATDTQQQRIQEAEHAAQEVEVHATPKTGIIRGVVVDEAIRPLAGVNVTLDGTNRTARTSSSGTFGFDGLREGAYFLTTHSPRHQPARVGVQVKAGDDAPAPVRIQLTTLPTATPYVDAYRLRLFVSAAVNLPGAGAYNSGATTVAGAAWSYLMDISPNSTTVQFEYDWSANTDLAKNGQGHATTHTSKVSEVIDDKTVSGPSPLVLRLNSTGEKGRAQRVSGDIRASPSGWTPAGFMVDQEVGCFIHVFHNFVPKADWQFGRDGDYPLPPGLLP